MTASIRRGTPDDFAALHALLKPMPAEVGLVPLDERKAAAFGRETLEHGRVVVALNEAGEIVGSIGLRACPPWYSSAPVLGDAWTYVRQDSRRLDVIAGLLRGAKDQAAQTGMPLLVGTLGGGDHDRKSTLYLRHGFEPAGGFYLWRP